MRSVRSTLVIGIAAIAAGCASSGQMNTADGIARLERARTARPNDAAVTRSLGIAYYKAGKYAEARTALAQAVRLDPRDGSAALFLGLTAEQQKDVSAAKAAYQTYIRFGKTSRVRKQLENRLAALTRQELQLSAKAAVAQEQQLATQQGSTKTVAVMPLRFVGPDTSLQPLERGLAELITTDLARSHQLTVVERARLQSLLDELTLQQSGQVDSTTTLRAGKIMQAGRIVNGQILQSEQRLRVDAAIVNTQTSALAGGAANENTLDELFAIEKAIVLQLFDSLGVTLTAEERKALDVRPTRSLQAFIAYSRGLRLEDQGKYEEASRSFNDALRLDPSFGQAAAKSAEMQAAALGAQLTTASMEANLSGTPEGRVASASQQGQAPPAGGATGASANTVANGINSSQSEGSTGSAGAGGGNTPSSNQPSKDPLASATGQETRTSTAKVTVIIRVP